jgi:hypothetical protein
VLVQLRSSVDEAIVRSRLGTHAKPSDVKLALTGDASVFKPDGKRLLILRRGAIPTTVIDRAYPFMYALRSQVSRNRGNYAGEDGEPEEKKHVGAGKRYRMVKEDGTISNTSFAPPVRSAIVGFFTRNPRMPFCRETAYTTAHHKEWGECLPFIQAIGELFREVAPDRYMAQMEAARKTHPAWIIPKTPFTTVTVNNTVSGAYHTDKGDYKAGFGVMAVFRKGTYQGADLVFPKYGVGADLQHGDVIFFDPHEVHGNIPFSGGIGKEAEDWSRISMVFYFREKMLQCGSPQEELARVKDKGAIP